jgi:tetratricopeptide (TPR) repeat protein
MSEPRNERLARCLAKTREAPSSAVAHFNLGLAYTDVGRVDRAERAYRRALELDPDLVEAWVNLGGVLLLKWDFKACLEANQQALERDADLLMAHFNMGQAYLYMSDAESLIRCNRRVLELDAKHAAGHYFLAVGLLATKQVAEARRALAKALSLGYQPRPEFLRSLERAERGDKPTHAPGDTKED